MDITLDKVKIETLQELQEYCNQFDYTKFCDVKNGKYYQADKLREFGIITQALYMLFIVSL